MNYTVLVSKSVRKQIDKLPEEVKPRTFSKIQALAVNPRPDGVKKLKGYTDQYRLRVGNYRIRYRIEDDSKNVRILQCKHRKDVYKDKN